MIGQRLTEKATGATWEVTAHHPGGRYVVTPVDEFGAPESVTAASLALRFGVKNAPEPTVDPDATQRGWDALADANAEQAARLARGEVHRVPQGTSPEDVFARVAAQSE